MWSGRRVDISNTYAYHRNVRVYFNSNSNAADPFSDLSITNCSFSGGSSASAYAVGIKEGQSDVHHHTLTNNRFLPNYPESMYADWDGTLTADDDTGLGYLNTADQPNHDASATSGSTLVK